MTVKQRVQISSNKREIIRARGGAAAVCSVVHEMINIGRFLSECFSQDSPYTRMSSEQCVWYYMWKVWCFSKPQDLSLQFPKRPMGSSNNVALSFPHIPCSQLVLTYNCATANEYHRNQCMWKLLCRTHTFTLIHYGNGATYNWCFKKCFPMKHILFLKAFTRI